jgi:hypothetical protein
MRRFVIPAFAALVFSTGLAAAQTTSATPQAAAPAPPSAAPQSTAPAHHWNHGRQAAMLRKWKAKFAAANTTHDGHLTLAQAQTAGLKPIAANFTAIDIKNRGYVTFNDILAWRLDAQAQKLQQKAAALRATD